VAGRIAEGLSARGVDAEFTETRGSVRSQDAVPKHRFWKSTRTKCLLQARQKEGANLLRQFVATTDFRPAEYLYSAVHDGLIRLKTASENFLDHYTRELTHIHQNFQTSHSCHLIIFLRKYYRNLTISQVFSLKTRLGTLRSEA
jgi:hypothetical protein